MTSYDVVVVGAGPAGSCAAYEVSKRGFKTLLLEEDRTVGVPVQCGEGLSAGTLESEGIEPRKEFVVREVGHLTFNFPGGSSFVIRARGFCIRRDIFDQHLAARAVSVGAHLSNSAKALEARWDESVLKVATEDGIEEIRFGLLLGCDGPKSNVAEWAGLISREAWKSRFVRAYEVRTEGVLSDSFEFYFDPKVAPEGYLWVFPKGETTSDIGIATSAPNSVARLDEFIRDRKLEGKIVRRTGGVIPSRGPIERSYANQVMIAGDAAGHTNPLTLGGIHTAMLCGRLAGETAAEALEKEDTSAAFLERYERRWKELPLASPLLTRAAGILYGMTTRELTRLGSLLNGRDLTHLGPKGRLGILAQFLYLRNWELVPRFFDLSTLVDGVKTSLLWGW